MEFIIKHGWILFILVTLLNGIILKFRANKYIKQNPELKEGYDNYFKGWIIFGSIPWTIMGIGDLTGMTNNIFEFFAPRMMNPIVLFFHFSIIGLYVLMTWWIYFKGGAEFMANHPGLLRNNPSAKYIKIMIPFMLLGGVIAMIFMWNSVIPIPKF
jgi:hypothetical protein